MAIELDIDTLFAAVDRGEEVGISERELTPRERRQLARLGRRREAIALLREASDATTCAREYNLKSEWQAAAAAWEKAARAFRAL